MCVIPASSGFPLRSEGDEAFSHYRAVGTFLATPVCFHCPPRRARPIAPIENSEILKNSYLYFWNKVSGPTVDIIRIEKDEIY